MEKLPIFSRPIFVCFWYIGIKKEKKRKLKPSRSQRGLPWANGDSRWALQEQPPDHLPI
ncbi:hypothetical protein LguiA_017798 [Lonicera macranthoides]